MTAVPSRTEERRLCYFFAKGACKYGSTCRYSHDARRIRELGGAVARLACGPSTTVGPVSCLPGSADATDATDDATVVVCRPTCVRSPAAVARQARPSPVFDFLALPVELQSAVLGFLDGRTLLRVLTCSKHLRSLCSEADAAWMRALQSDFGVSPMQLRTLFVGPAGVDSSTGDAQSSAPLALIAAYRRLASCSVYTCGAGVLVQRDRALFLRPRWGRGTAAAHASSASAKTGGPLLLRFERDSGDVYVQTCLGRWCLDEYGHARRRAFDAPSRLEMDELDAVLRAHADRRGGDAAAPAPDVHTVPAWRARHAQPLWQRCVPPMRDRFFFGRWLFLCAADPDGAGRPPERGQWSVRHPQSAVQLLWPSAEPVVHLSVSGSRQELNQFSSL